MTCALLSHVPECSARREADPPPLGMGLAEAPRLRAALQATSPRALVQTPLWGCPLRALGVPSLDTVCPSGSASESLTRQQVQSVDTPSNSILLLLKGNMTTCTSQERRAD